MKKIVLILLLLIFIVPFSRSQSDDRILGGKAASLGRLGILDEDVWAVHNNPGALGFLKSMEASVYYENRFLVKSLNQQGVVFAYPTKAGVFGVDVNLYGDQLYRRSAYRFSYGMALGPKISIGIGLVYLNSRFAQDYGTYHAFTGEVGLLVKITPKWRLAAHVYNPIRAKFQPYDDERLPTLIKLGMGYRFSKQFDVVIGAEKDIEYKTSFRAGLNYRPIDMLFIRLGVATAPVETTFGVGLKFKGFYVDIGSSWNLDLGYSPQISLRYAFENIGKNPRLHVVEE